MNACYKESVCPALSFSNLVSVDDRR